MSLSALTVAVAEAHTEKINHWVIGGLSLGILLAMIAALIVFGAGREHS
ncbi:hypothetical protein [Nocardioides sp.]|jgi:hypothetical protein|nr:hypothetical protein [Nocardioides sp.]